MSNPIPITIAAVHVHAGRKTLCKLPIGKVDQWCPIGMWQAVKPEYRCAVCDSEVRLQTKPLCEAA